MKWTLDKKAIVSLSSVAIIALLFVFVSLIASKYENEISAFAQSGGMSGMVAYVFITMLAIVVAPISTIPLIPVASGLWGWFMAAVLSIIGWTIGAQAAFYLARHFGRPLVEKIVSIDKLNKLEKRFPKRNLFWTVIFFRMAVPVDVLSYALGLFSNMNSRSYFFATVIGITPFAFVFAYAGTLDVRFQLLALLAGVIVGVSWYASKKTPLNNEYK